MLIKFKITFDKIQYNYTLLTRMGKHKVLAPTKSNGMSNVCITTEAEYKMTEWSSLK